MSIKQQQVRAHDAEGALEMARMLGLENAEGARFVQDCGGPQGDGDLWTVSYEPQDEREARQQLQRDYEDKTYGADFMETMREMGRKEDEANASWVASVTADEDAAMWAQYDADLKASREACAGCGMTKDDYMELLESRDMDDPEYGELN